MTDKKFTVLVNHEEAYSIWMSGRAVPAGWTSAGFAGSRQTCLDHIGTVWTDMRPLSLRSREIAS